MDADKPHDSPADRTLFQAVLRPHRSLGRRGFALLMVAVAQVTGLRPGTFIHSFGDAHLYLNHLDQARLQLTRQPQPLPTLRMNPEAKDLFALRYEDFMLEGYDPHPHIKAAVAV